VAERAKPRKVQVTRGSHDEQSAITA